MRLVLLALMLGWIVLPAAAAMPPAVLSTAANAASSGLLDIAERRPLGAVLKTIAARYPGRALDARMVERDGRALYQIKWLGDDGKVRAITADAESGQILSVR